MHATRKQPIAQDISWGWAALELPNRLKTPAASTGGESKPS